MRNSNRWLVHIDKNHVIFYIYCIFISTIICLIIRLLHGNIWLCL
jgi:hypothetical protein